MADLIGEAERLLVPPSQVQEAAASRGLTYALQGSDVQTQARLLTELCNYLPQNLQEEALRKALSAVKAVQDEVNRLGDLKRLVPKLSPSLLSEALELGKAMPTGMNRVRTLKVLAPKLSPDLLSEALDLAQAFRATESDYCRAMALSALVDWLPEDLKTEVSSDALTTARAIQPGWSGDNVYCASALGAVADVLPEPLRSEVLQEALNAAKAIEEHWRRSISLADLAPKLPEALRAEVVKEALDAIVEEKEEWAKSQAFPALAPELSPDLLPKALRAAMGIKREIHRTKAVAAVAAQLPEAIPEAVAAIENTQSDGMRAFSLAMLAPQLPPEQLLEAVVIANSIAEERDRITTLIALAAPISKMPKSDLSSLWLAILQVLSSSLSQRELLRSVLALAAVIYVLGDRQTVAKTIAAIQEIGEWWPQA